MRFPLLELFAVVFVCGFACVALVRPSAVLASLFYCLTLSSLLLATLCAIARRGEARFFWIGFVIGGSAYLWWIRSPEPDSQPTSRALEWAFRRIHGEPPGAPNMGGGMFSVAPSNPQTNGDGETPPLVSRIGSGGQALASNAYWEAQNDFMTGGHCLFTLLLAWFAGHFCRFVRERAP